MNPKVVITGGCSYSQFRNADITWPVHLLNALKPDKVGLLGQGAVGNEFISRVVISTVQLALDEGYKPEDILVGIMWSGCDRGLYYSESANTWDRATKMPNCEDPVDGHKTILKTLSNFSNLGKLITFEDYQSVFNEGPHHQSATPMTIRSAEKSGFYTLNSHWEDELTVGYFRKYTNPAYMVMQTCEHVLRTEWFLKSLNINYFMTEYDLDVFTYHGPHRGALDREVYKLDDEGISVQHGNHHSRHLKEMSIKDTHPEVSYLYNMIDRDYWLPIDNMGDWATNVSEYDYRDPGMDPHPSTAQHKDFTEKVILPFLLEKYNISRNNIDT